MEPGSSRRTKIVCTLGPASSSIERIEALMRAGMDVARINFSHGTLDEHAAHRRGAVGAERLNIPVAILADLQGPKIRTGSLAGGQPVCLETGLQFTISTEPVVATASASRPPTPLPNDVQPGDRVLLSDGAIELLGGGGNRCAVPRRTRRHARRAPGHQFARRRGQRAGSHREGSVRSGLRVHHRVDYIALSFVRRAEDLHEAKQLIATSLRKGTAGAAPAGYHPTAYAAERPSLSSPSSRSPKPSSIWMTSCTSRTASWWRAATSAWRCPWSRCRSSRSASSRGPMPSACR